jgi:DNA mismatch repair protein MutS
VEHGAAARWTGEGQAADAPATPMIRQYLEAKARAGDAFLFFRLGDFYELFFEDAVRAAELLGITLTARSKGEGRVPMCGVPFHAARRYVARMLEAGHKVAICEQVETPGSGPGIVRREIVRVITPGTVLDEDVLEATRNAWLAALSGGEGSCGAALLDASTGEFRAFEGTSLVALLDTLAAHDPRELLIPRDAPAPLRSALRQRWPGLPTTELEAALFEAGRAGAYLRTHFVVATLEGFGLEGALRATGAAGAALRYVKDTQRTDARHVDALRRVPLDAALVLDDTTRANLEVLRTLREGARAGSLLGVVDRTVTPLGARRLAQWLVSPLLDLSAIEARLEAVEELSRKSVWQQAWSGLLRQVCDIERIVGRMATGLGTPRDLAALGRSLAVLPDLASALDGCRAPLWQALANPLRGFEALATQLAAAVVDTPPADLDEGGFIRPGYSAELDALVAVGTDGRSTLVELEQRERARTGIHSLKIRYTRVFGYFLEVTRANLHLVPDSWERRQTTVGAERFVTPELKAWETTVLGADEKRIALEQALFQELREAVLAQAPALRAAADSLASADALLSFARVAAEHGYCRPVVDDSEVLELQGSRHPVVEQRVTGEPFVPNDLRLDRATSQLVVLTGPNMAGKSTLLRQVALTVLLAQSGSFVPATRARVGRVDRIFTRVGATDDLARGQSTFMVEMAETAAILHHASERSLVVLDEIGRGTSTFDGLSIAWAVAEHLHDAVGARTLFATHYHELIELARTHPRVRNLSMGVREASGKVVFLRTVVEGGASKSYGIEVARLAGLPARVLRRAREVLRRLETEGAPRPNSVRPEDSGQLPLQLRDGEQPRLGPDEVTSPRSASRPAQGVLAKLRQQPLDETTPLQALQLLTQLQQELAADGS